MGLIAVTTVAVVCSIAFTVYKYNKGGFDRELENTFLYKLFYNQYYIPDFYNRFLVVPYTKLSEFAWKKIDLKIIDFVVDTIALIIYKSGEKSRGIQSGNLSSMLRWMVVGILVLIVFAALYSPIK